MGQHSCNYGTALEQLWDATLAPLGTKKTLLSGKNDCEAIQVL
jgi:hypothetical protein